MKNMNELIQLAESIGELAKLPDTTRELIQAQHNTLNTQSARIQNLENRLNAIIHHSVDRPQHSSPFEFILENDDNGFADDSWEQIIKQGQDLQKQYWQVSERWWQEHQGDSPSGAGWYGTAESPVITIKCVEPVYRFHDTVRLPGRFQVKGNGHWSSFLRFYGDGDSVLRDSIPWGVATNAPIGIYVEPTTELQDGRSVRNFEQSIQGVMLIGHRGSMPVYIAQNAFNFRMADCNVQCHQGAQISIKHGPAIDADWYPVKQVYPPNFQSVYLPDPVFSNMLIEGPHKFLRKSCGILASGNNMIFDRLNFYGHMCGIMAHGGQGRIIQGCTMHDGGTHDGRHWVAKEHLVLAHLITDRNKGKNHDGIAGNCSEFPINVIERGQPAPSGGWFNGGEVGL